MALGVSDPISSIKKKGKSWAGWLSHFWNFCLDSLFQGPFSLFSSSTGCWDDDILDHSKRAAICDSASCGLVSAAGLVRGFGVDVEAAKSVPMSIYLAEGC